MQRTELPIDECRTIACLQADHTGTVAHQQNALNIF
jgi:hypothetical protein